MQGLRASLSQEPRLVAWTGTAAPATPPRGTIPGLNTGGDGGLLGLALSPTFAQDGLLYAYVSTATDNRVVRLPLGGTPNPVLTGIPHGAVHNGGGLLFDSSGHLLVGTWGDGVWNPGGQYAGSAQKEDAKPRAA